MADVTCSCEGCRVCKGSELGCTCDVDWDAMTERRLDHNCRYPGPHDQQLSMRCQLGEHDACLFARAGCPCPCHLLRLRLDRRADTTHAQAARAALRGKEEA